MLGLKFVQSQKSTVKLHIILKFNKCTVLYFLSQSSAPRAPGSSVDIGLIQDF